MGHPAPPAGGREFGYDTSINPTMAVAQSRVGTVLRGKWHLDRLLGVGGMASVYAATHRNRMRGAVKMLHLELSTHDPVRARFLREGYVANNVEHPGVVRVLDDDITEDGSVFVVMELLEGQGIDAIFASRAGRRLELYEVLAIADDVLDVLVVAHERGIVHRDLKPENLFLTHSGELKVLDFGIAKMRDGMSPSVRTATGHMMGSPGFMAPEQALGNWDQVDGRTDLWAVGATMFYLLSGRHVHEMDTIQKLLLASMTMPAPPLASVMHGVPSAVCAIVDCALAFNRDDRFPDAREMQRAVREVRATLRNAATAVSGPPPGGVEPRAIPLPGGAVAAETRLSAGILPPNKPVLEAHHGTAAPVTSRIPEPPTRRRSRAGPKIWLASALLGGLLAVVVAGGAFVRRLVTRAPVVTADSSAPNVAAGAPTTSPSEPVGMAAPEPTPAADPTTSATSATSAALPATSRSNGAAPSPAKRAPPAAPTAKPAATSIDQW